MIFGDGLAKIAHLQDKIGFAFLGSFEKACQPGIGIVHEVFVDVGDEADADFSGFPQWEIQQERDADYGGVFEEGASLHGNFDSLSFKSKH